MFQPDGQRRREQLAGQIGGVPRVAATPATDTVNNGGNLPIGRRVAQLRTRLGMNQQVFAGRIGKSKSWVDKVERGQRTLDRLSVIQTVAEVLGVTPEVAAG